MPEKAKTEEEFLAEMPDEQREHFERLKRREELHPDLTPWVEEEASGFGGPFLKHPLVYVMLGNKTDDGLYPFAAEANGIYEQKQKALERAMAEGKWFVVIHVLYERPYRLWALQKIEHELSDREYWEMLGSIWTDSENIWQNAEEWEDRLSEDRCDREYIMEDEERELLALLDDELLVFRGYERPERLKAGSWTLDRDRAEWFARRLHLPDRGFTPQVATAIVKKADVIAYFIGRDENEIVVLPDNLDVVCTEEVDLDGE